MCTCIIQLSCIPVIISVNILSGNVKHGNHLHMHQSLHGLAVYHLQE